MTSGTSIDLREVVFINPDAESGYDSLPPRVGEVADGIVTLLQNGRLPENRKSWRMLKGTLQGIGEIRIPEGTNTFRVYLWMGCGPALYILDAGMKKSPTGSDIPQWQQERLADRRNRAAGDCRDQQAAMQQAAAVRTLRRQHDAGEGS